MTESTETTVLPQAQPAPAAPVETPAPEAPKPADAPAAPAEAPAAVVEQAPPAPSEPEAEVELDEGDNTPPVASRPCPAGPNSNHHRDNPYAA